MLQQGLAGGAEVDITPTQRAFLQGYPHVERYHTSVHDRLRSSALWLDDGRQQLVFIANDLLYVPRWLCQHARQRIAERHDISPDHVMITATHTHSGPMTSHMLATEDDPLVPLPDPAYLRRLEDAIVAAADRAAENARPATLATAVSEVVGLGGNRRDPAGPSIRQVPILAAYDADSAAPIALMAVCSMHPTVLHEDSTLISGDFPGLARQHLQRRLLAPGRPFVYHMGASGNQSPRHVVDAHTVAQADRLGRLLADAIETALNGAPRIGPWHLRAATRLIDLPARAMPTIGDAEQRLTAARERLDHLRRQNAQRATVRTAEVDWFGAERTLTLARAAAQGRVQQTVQSLMPAEVQLFQVGDLQLLAWPGEVFVEFAIDVRRHFPAAHVITLANGELQGYLVTKQAIDEGAYEANNALFASPASGHRLVEASMSLLQHAADKPKDEKWAAR